MSDIDHGFDVITLVAMALATTEVNKEGPIPQHDSILTGQLYYEELMTTRNPNRFINVARMDRPTFLSLIDLLTTEGGLKNSMFISSGEKLLIFIHNLVGFSNRQIAERWQHSGSTISLVIHEVTESILACKQHLFKEPKEGDPVQDYIAANDKFRPYFENCIGALDGTHITAIVPIEEHGVFRNRKKYISQNVLAVVNFNLTFSYALCGWEGSAHDSRVLDDARAKGLPFIMGKFYLGDCGYALSSTVLTPYRGVRYHLKEWALGNRKPQNAKELFNLRHSSLRNAIERIFGVVKKRFPSLVTMRSFEFSFQCDLIMCALVLHNFIRLNQLYEDYFYDDDDVDVVQDVAENAEEEVIGNANALYQWRNGIANAMWDDYVAHIMDNDN
jgi:DDE superfamily endonuclease